MSDAGKSQEPSMEEILASIRRIIAEDEAGRARAGAAPMAPRGSADSHSRTPPRPPARNSAFEPPPVRTAPSGEAGDMVLDLTNMVAADGSVVTIAPTFPPVTRSAPPPPMAQAAPPPLPSGFAPQGSEQQTVAYGGFPRRAPPPGPGAEPRTPSFSPPQAPPPMPPAAPQAGFGTTDSPSRGVRSNGGTPLPPNLSEDSPSRRVFKRRHTAGSAFAELAQSGYTPQAQDPNSNFGKVPAGAVATELDMSPPPAPHSSPFEPPPAPQAPPALPSYVAQDPYIPAAFAPPPQVEAPPPAPVAPPPAALSEEQMRATVASTAEPIVRSWIDANLATMIEQQLATLVQERVSETVATSLPQAVDQRIHQNVESNLGPYIEDRVGAHVDARLAAAVEEKVTAAVKQQVAAAVNQQIAEAVSKQVAAAVAQQLQAQQQNVTRVVDERVKSEIRGLFQRLAGN